jgi:hypothetical protein
MRGGVNRKNKKPKHLMLLEVSIRSHINMKGKGSYDKEIA